MSKLPTNERGYIPFPHPGDTLREDYLKPLRISTATLAAALALPLARAAAIIKGRRAIDADTALRLARYFNTTAKFWLNLQNSYDLAKTAETKIDKITRAVTPRDRA
jgi:addiction module HigA family antidote